MSTAATAKFTLDCGRFVVNSVQATLEEYAFAKGVDIGIKRVKKSWMEYGLLITIRGEPDKVDWFIRVVKLWIEENA